MSKKNLMSCDDCGDLHFEKFLHFVEDDFSGRGKYLCDLCFASYTPPQSCENCGERISQHTYDNHDGLCKDCNEMMNKPVEEVFSELKGTL